MPRKRNAVKDLLQEFQSKCTNTDPVAVQRAVREALCGRHCLLVKQAAELCEERLFYDLEKDLLVLLLGAIFHRSENAFTWLLDLVAEGDRASARFVVEHLAIYPTDERLSEQLQAALAKRGDDALTAFFREIWLQHGTLAKR